MSSRNLLPHIQAKQFLSGGIRPTKATSAQKFTLSRLGAISNLPPYDEDHWGNLTEISTLLEEFPSSDNEPPYIDIIKAKIQDHALVALEELVDEYADKKVKKDIDFEYDLQVEIVRLGYHTTGVTQGRLSRISEKFLAIKIAKMPKKIDKVLAVSKEI